MTQPTLNDARAALQSAFGYPDFRPGQSLAVGSVLEKRDTLVILPTGGGKSLCFQVPALLLDGLTVVVSPLISLMKDQVDALVARGLPAAYINSTLTGAQVSDRLARAQRGELKLLYVAPERFDAGSTAERLRDIGVSLLAVDEAHCISEWGHDFRPSYMRVGNVRQLLGNPPVIALTATATPEVREDIVRQLRLRSPETVITGFDRVNLKYYVIATKNEAQKDASLIHALRERDGLAVVYASTRKAVERITGVLQSAGISAVAYHAGLDDAHRHEVQDAFMKESARAIVATNAFGMGIDKPNVRLVVHYTMPGTLEAYYQEAGRAGRDGLASDCILLHSYPDRFTHEFFINGSLPERKLVERVYAVLQRAASAGGTVPSSAADLARMVGGKTNTREVESAMRILVRAGAVASEADAPNRVFVRLLAAPARIQRELPSETSMERGLLRALWRVAGKALYTGTHIDPDGLPPGFGGFHGVLPMLEWLQERQFIVWERAGGGAALTRPSADLSAFKVDWDSLERRRRGEMSKLDAVQKYAYTPGCRRAHVLKYFGDAAARSPCNGCDNCLGLKLTPPGAEEVSQVRKARGRGANRSGASKRQTQGTAPTDIPVVEAADAPLLQELRRLRTNIAREEQIPAYRVFSDRTLAEMAVRRPASVNALADVHGVGPAKLASYGEQFISLIRSLPETEVA